MPIVLAYAEPPAVVAPSEPATNPQSPKIVPPAWVRKPTGEDIARVYPSRAASGGINGAAAMKCDVSDRGLLLNCVITAEAPPGEHFGDATLALADRFKLRPRTKDGVPVPGGSISIPVYFRVSR